MASAGEIRMRVPDRSGRRSDQAPVGRDHDGVAGGHRDRVAPAGHRRAGARRGGRAQSPARPDRGVLVAGAVRSERGGAARRADGGAGGGVEGERRRSALKQRYGEAGAKGDDQGEEAGVGGEAGVEGSDGEDARVVGAGIEQRLAVPGAGAQHVVGQEEATGAEYCDRPVDSAGSGLCPRRER